MGSQCSLVFAGDGSTGQLNTKQTNTANACHLWKTILQSIFTYNFKVFSVGAYLNISVFIHLEKKRSNFPQNIAQLQSHKFPKAIY